MAGQFDNYRILIADDNGIELETLKELAEAIGVSCETALDGSEALEKLLNAPKGYYSLFLSDIFMPKMKGFETATQVRTSSHPDARTLPIIGISADTNPKLYETAISAGMSSMTLKPVTQDVLSAFFTLFLNEKKANVFFAAQLQNRIESERRMREFIQSISTDIRTPLAGIMEFADLLKSGEISGDEAKNYADVIINATTRIYQVINNGQLDSENGGVL